MATAQSTERSSSKKPCRACVDFKTWAKMQGKKTETAQSSSVKPTATATAKRSECPADSEELGHATWTYLHTMAAYYPDTPSLVQQNDMHSLISNFSKFYPCNYCAEHMKDWLQDNPPKTRTRSDLCQWLCVMHNDVNGRLGKELFDCSKIDERWLTGWKDGSCD